MQNCENSNMAEMSAGAAGHGLLERLCTAPQRAENVSSMPTPPAEERAAIYTLHQHTVFCAGNRPLLSQNLNRKMGLALTAVNCGV